MLGILNETEIEALLHAEVTGRIGCHTDGRTYVVPVTYAYHDGCVYGHSGHGLKLQMMRHSPEVCFEVEHLEDLARWRSVIAWGRFEELRGAEAVVGMQRLLDRLRPLMVSATARPSHGTSHGHGADVHGQQAVVYRIRLSEKTGRFEER